MKKLQNLLAGRNFFKNQSESAPFPHRRRIFDVLSFQISQQLLKVRGLDQYPVGNIAQLVNLLGL